MKSRLLAGEALRPLDQRFYQGLKSGFSKSRAIQEAVLEVKARFPHPYYWAPFILMGKS